MNTYKKIDSNQESTSKHIQGVRYSHDQFQKVSLRECSYAALSDLSKRYDTFILDAYGVFWGSSAVGVLPGAKEAMAFLVSEGKQVGVLSNSTQLSIKAKEKLLKYGLHENIHYHFYLTSGEYARKILSQGDLPFPTPRDTYYLFGLDHPSFTSHLNLFDETRYRQVDSLHDADFIYINIPHIRGNDQHHPDPFIEEIQKLQGHSIPVLCPNPDRVALEGSPPSPVVRQGTIAEIFKRYDFPVYYIGKPDPRIYIEALTLFPNPVDKQTTLMIGDTPGTDIRGANSIGIASALVVEGGVAFHSLQKGDNESEEAPSNEAMIKECIEKLPEGDMPSFVMKRFSISTQA